MSNKRWAWYPMADHWNWNAKQVKVMTFTNAEEVRLVDKHGLQLNEDFSVFINQHQ